MTSNQKNEQSSASSEFSDHDDDSYDSGDDDDCVDIGFINENEKTEVMKLHLHSSALYPCKVGGRPQWLHFENLPNSDKDLACDHCKAKLKFLLQIYAPLNNRKDEVDDEADVQSDDSERDSDSEKGDSDTNGFHRYIFVFVCTNNNCLKRTIRALRSQMSRKNDIYSYEPPPKPTDILETIKEYLTKFYQHNFEKNLLKFCNICGFPSSKKCSKCKITFYCDEEHQKLDWSKFNHKEICNKYQATNNLDERVKVFIDYELNKDASDTLFPEFEILNEVEEIHGDHYEIDQKRVDEQLELNKNLQKDLDTVPENDYDEDFMKFKKRISNNPKQVIRYDRGGEPLWCTKNGKLLDEPPKCEKCHSNRIFECQITPQLLNYLKLDEDKNKNTLDWAGIYIYTCENNCTLTSYSEEFVFKQDYN